MTLEEFDESKVAVLNATDFVEKIEGFPEVCVCMFSNKMFQKFVEKFSPKRLGKIHNETDDFPVFEVKIGKTRLAVTLLPVGAPASAANLEDVIALGAKKILAVGCAGCLVPEVEEFGVVIPTSAIRDEGTSFHYMQPADEIELDLDMAEAVERFIKSTGIPYIKGRTWTTDGFYRETKSKVERRKKQGAIMVEMECSALAAVCRFRGVKFAQILWGADTLAFEEYQPRSLIDGTADSKEKMLLLALDCAKFLAEENV